MLRSSPGGVRAVSDFDAIARRLEVGILLTIEAPSQGIARGGGADETNFRAAAGRQTAGAIFRKVLPLPMTECHAGHLLGVGAERVGYLSNPNLVSSSTKCAVLLNQRTVRGRQMSDVIDFLEGMGRDARLSDASPSDLELALDKSGIDPELQKAILAKDQPKLEALLQLSPQCGMLFPGKEDEQEEDGEETPAREEEKDTEGLLHISVSPAG